MYACLSLVTRGAEVVLGGWRGLALSGLLLIGATAQADPLASLAGRELKPVRSFLERSSVLQPGSTDVIELRRADLDADGREELVMLWGLFGATSTWPSLTVFRRGPQGWQEAGTQDLPGQVERLEVQGREILLELRLPEGEEEEARCCHSVKSRYRWNGMRLLSARASALSLR